MPEQPATATISTSPVLTDCWKKIGVQGDSSCPELVRHIHCHNCPVYSASAAIFLDRALPQDYLSEWTTHFAREKPVLEQATLSVVLFRIGSEWFALPVTIFKEISESKSIHSLPHRRDNLVLGLVNSRGELLICVSLGKILGVAEVASGKTEPHRVSHPYLLVIGDGSNRLVFPVEEVGGIHHFRLSEIKAVPATVTEAPLTYSKGLLSWRDRSVGYLDAELLLYTLNRNLA